MECQRNYKIPIQVTDLSVKEVMQKVVENGQEEGFFICDISDIVEKYQKWKNVLPRVKPFYVKANDIRVVLETLTALELSFDCASMGEIMRIISLGVSPDRIIFANPAKTISQLKYASQVGVSKMTFDSEDEIYKIKEVFPSAELVLRIKCDDPTALYVLGTKFGAEPNTEAEILLKLAKSLNLKVIGVSFHIGSGCKNYMAYQKAIASARKVFDMGSNLGFNFFLLDIGGGFPGHRNNDMIEIGGVINDALDTYFPDESIQIISEPGRYFVDSAFTLATSIHTSKTTVRTDENGKEDITKAYYANISIYQSLMTIAFGESYIPITLFDKQQSPLYPSIIWGSTCDACDKLSSKTQLPELKSGDWLYFETAGAYTITLSCEFNGYPTTAVHSIIKIKDWLLLTKEVTNPLPKARFIQGNDPQTCKSGLSNQYFIYNKYF